MVTRLQKIRLGFFFIVSLLALLITLSIILSPQFLEIKDEYLIGYRDITLSGLQVGGTVKYHGLNVGYINDIYIDPEDIRRVIVKIRLEHGTPIRKDTYADIANIGITGLKVIELRGGSNEAEPLEPGGFIQTGKSITEIITGKAEVIAEKMEMTLNNISSFTNIENQKKIMSLVENTSKTITELNDLLNKNKSSLSRTFSHSEKAAVEFHQLIVQTNKTMKKLNAWAGSDSLKKIINNISEITETLSNANLVGLVDEFNLVMKHTNRVLKEIDISLTKSRTEMQYSLVNLKESIEYLNQFSRMISENPSVLIRGTSPKTTPDIKLEK